MFIATLYSGTLRYIQISALCAPVVTICLKIVQFIWTRRVHLVSKVASVGKNMIFLSPNYRKYDELEVLRVELNSLSGADESWYWIIARTLVSRNTCRWYVRRNIVAILTEMFDAGKLVSERETLDCYVDSSTWRNAGLRRSTLIVDVRFFNIVRERTF